MIDHRAFSRAKESLLIVRGHIEDHLSIKTIAPLLIMIMIFNGVLIPSQINLLKPFEPETTLAQQVTIDLVEASKNDEEYPTVEITSHKNGDHVNGKIKLTAKVHDNVGLVDIGFYDNSLENKISDSKEAVFDTSRYYGTRIIYAKVKDYAGNTTISSVLLNVENDKAKFIGK